KIKLVHVPYKGGPPAFTSLLSGETQASVATLPNVMPHLRSGRVRALGVTTPERSLSAPHIPTIAESGLPGYEMKPWIALLGPAGLDRALVEKLNAAVSKALRDPAVVKTMVAQGLDPWIGTAAELGERMVKDRDRLAKLIAEIGVRNE